jgi:hypothetical protein
MVAGEQLYVPGDRGGRRRRLFIETYRDILSSIEHLLITATTEYKYLNKLLNILKSF